MARPRKGNSSAKGNSAATVDYEAQLWQMADALQGSIDATECEHVCLGLPFQKYMSDLSNATPLRLGELRWSGPNESSALAGADDAPLKHNLS